MLQAYDFLQLFDRYNCTLQMGGSDQWGNITAGCDLIRKLRAGRAHGLVMPLVTTASGVKFGKTEAGAVWLDPARTSDFQFFQFWLNTDDRDAVKYLKFFTFLDAGTGAGARGRTGGGAREARRAARTRARGDRAGARRGRRGARRTRERDSLRRQHGRRECRRCARGVCGRAEHGDRRGEVRGAGDVGRRRDER